MLWDHFNRLLGYCFSWVCRMRDEAGSWEGVLRNNTECSIPFLQSREAADKLRHTREENTQKHTRYPVQYIYTDKLSFSSPWPPSTPQSNPYPLFLFHFHWFSRVNPFFFLFFFENGVTKKTHVRQIVYYPHSFHCVLFTRSSRGTEIDLECLFKSRCWPTENILAVGVL